MKETNLSHFYKRLYIDHKVSKTQLSFPRSITVWQKIWGKKISGVTFSEYFSGFEISVKFCVLDNHMLKIYLNFLGSLCTQQSNLVNLIMQIRSKWLILLKKVF
jgi:hypothetical protein